MPRHNPKSDSSDLRINGADLTGVILRAKTTEKRHRINMRRNSKMYSLVSTVQYGADSWIPCPSGYTRGQGWNCLFRAWLGYRISRNPKNGETVQDRLRWAITIQNIQTDFGLQRSAFPDLGIEGDYVFCYDLSKQMKLEDLDYELWFKRVQEEKARAYSGNSRCIYVN
ncbi:MAG: hypothetical protein WBL68_03110 [Nitrososphaeraceae archaeon]